MVLIGDGMADRPLKELSGKTCLQAANTPNMDMLASEGEVGMLRTIPEGFPPGSDVANLSVLGYDPLKYYTGRAPFEAASMGVKLGERDIAYRCNLVTLKILKSGKSPHVRGRAFMDDYSSGHISTKEAKPLIEEINQKLGNSEINFYPGVSYRHLMVWKNGEYSVDCTPPHDITGKDIADYLPVGDGEDVLRNIMMSSVEILESHPVNRIRARKGLKPANSIWLWGQGKKPNLPTFKGKYGLRGALISAVNLTKGLGVHAGFSIINVKGATGWIDTNYYGKAKAALKALKTVDFVYLHVEAPDEAGHRGDIDLKIKAIEDFDLKVVGPITDGITGFKDYKILLLPDHPTPIEAKTHTSEPVPFVIYRSDRKVISKAKGFDEDIANVQGVLKFEEGYKLMDYFIGGE